MSYPKIAGIPYPYLMVTQAGLIVVLVVVYFLIGSGEPIAPKTKSTSPAARKLNDHEWMEKYGPVDINNATQAELERVNGIGPAKAKIIIENRPHQSVDDLAGLQKIFPRDLEKWEGQIICNPPNWP